MTASIIIAGNSGFCFGVKRAIGIAEKTTDGVKTIFSLGPLIHNPQEVKRLEKKGIKVLKNPKKLKNATIILRTHGITKSLLLLLKKKQCHLVDATCPFVKRAQDIIRNEALKNKKIIIYGEKNHPEVKALVSYGGDKCFVVENGKTLGKYDLSGEISVVSQTTQVPKEFSEFVKKIRKLNPRAKIFDTICRATIDRQSSAKKLARKVDIMIVTGGKNSGNTKRLAEICSKYTKTYYVETALEIKKDWFKNIKLVGIAAGASTPDWIIREVKNKIRGLYKK